MPAKKNDNDDVILKMLASDDGQAIDKLYQRYHVQLFNIINNIVQDDEASKDLIQDLFTTLWQRRHTLHIKKPIIRYLAKSAVNRSYNYLRDSKPYARVQIDSPEIFKMNVIKKYSENTVELDELKKIINYALSSMPPKSKVAFILSRKHKRTYPEIADILNISQKAVEKRISKSIRHLHSILEPYLKGLLTLLIL